MERVKLILVPLIVRAIAFTLRLTLSVRVVDENGRPAGPSHPWPRGRIYAFWHGQLLFTTFTFSGCGVYGVVSQSRDGEYLSRILSAWGYRLIRGSSSRGGSDAYRNALELLKSGAMVGITPDGPRGPYRTPHPGCLRMARESGADVIPMACGCSRSRLLSSWDRFQIPLPLSKVVVVFGAPISVPADADMERLGESLRETLNGLSEKAETLSKRT